MFKRILMAGLAVGTIALGAPSASANHVDSRCTFNAVTQADATGDGTWEAAVRGWTVADGPVPVTIRCEIRVGTSVRGSTSTQSGTTVAVVAERVQFVALDSEVVQLCAVWTAGNHSGTNCVPTTTNQIPPEEFYDALEGIFDVLTDLEVRFVDPNVCPVLTGLNDLVNGPVIDVRPGTADPSTGARGGDVYINDVLFWDCPGYESTP